MKLERMHQMMDNTAENLYNLIERICKEYPADIESIASAYHELPTILNALHEQLYMVHADEDGCVKFKKPSNNN